jgi:hypothetical protein
MKMQTEKEENAITLVQKAMKRVIIQEKQNYPIKAK